MSMDKGEILKEGIYNSHEPLIHWQLAIISRSSLPFFFFFYVHGKVLAAGPAGKPLSGELRGCPIQPQMDRRVYMQYI